MFLSFSTYELCHSSDFKESKTTSHSPSAIGTLCHSSDFKESNLRMHIGVYELLDLHLLGQLLWFDLFCRPSHYGICSFPLRTRDKNRSHRSFRRHVQFQPPQMCLLPRKCDARSGIDGELYHVVPVIKQKLSELRRPLSFGFCQHRQIEADHQPSHLELLRIHGLYLPDLPDVKASR